MRLMVIGSDCAGKTDFIEEINKELNYIVLKGSSFEDSQCNNQELFDKFQERAFDDRNIIFDRHMYCNYVYATIYKDYSVLTAEQRRYIEDLMRHDTLVVYIYANTETLIERHSKRGDDYVSNGKFDTIKDHYLEVLQTCTLPMLTIDSTNQTTQEMAKYFFECVDYINPVIQKED